MFLRLVACISYIYAKSLVLPLTQAHSEHPIVGNVLDNYGLTNYLNQEYYATIYFGSNQQ